jgi:hypothetical protein
MKNSIEQAKKRQAKRLKQAKQGRAAVKSARLLAQETEEKPVKVKRMSGVKRAKNLPALLRFAGIDPDACEFAPVYFEGVKIATIATAKEGHPFWDSLDP